ncbi:MAG TPA: NAD(P)-binding domain-containing protein, partial [Roseiflexaceae bacterium]|nr:NAD(P)-binding domain-containing protein [Roseiflexaceae bacterium]
MRIGMIGAGNVGQALGTASVRAGYSVSIVAVTPGEAEQIASAIGATAAASNRDVVANADTIILAVPFDAVQAIVDEVGAEFDGKILIDV